MCNCQPYEGDFRSSKIVSSSGDVVYINSLNWGISGDYQLTSVTTDSNKLKQRSDSSNSIKGLDPFLYRFKKDTLFFFMRKKNKHTFRGLPKGINVRYIYMDNEDYYRMRNSDTEVKLVP